MDNEKDRGLAKVTKQVIMKPGSWSFVVLQVLRSTVLTASAKNAYAALGSFLRSRHEAAIQETEARIADAYGVSTRTLKRDLVELEKAKLITKERRGRSGNVYYFLDVSQADLEGDRGANRPTVAYNKKKNGTGLSYNGDKKGTGKARIKSKTGTGLSHSTQAYPIKNNSKKSNLKKQHLENPKGLSKPKARGPDQEYKNAAFAFLLNYFERKKAKSLIQQFGPLKILHVKRQFSVRKSDPENPAGLIIYALRQPIKENEIASAANEMLGQEFTERERREDIQERKKEADKSIEDWLKGQPDSEALRERAVAEVKFKTQGSKIDFLTIRRMVNGALWRIRRQRERSGLIPAEA